MDTGSYMANQMDNQIEAGNLQREDLENFLENSRFKYEFNKSLIYDSISNKDICICYPWMNVKKLLILLNEHYE